MFDVGVLSLLRKLKKGLVSLYETLTPRSLEAQRNRWIRLIFVPIFKETRYREIYDIKKTYAK